MFFELYDLLGKRVMMTPITQQQTIIERNDLQTGLYFYRITNENQIIGNGKLVIE